ncbi:protein CutA homolog isoform X3 [Trichomycterus rosablanca]
MLYPVILPLTLRAYSSLTGSYLAGHHSLMLINCPSERTAKDIGRYIMEKRMAARVNISPLIYTMFYWKEEIQDSSEVLLLVRTRTLHIQRLTDMVKQPQHRWRDTLCPLFSSDRLCQCFNQVLQGSDYPSAFPGESGPAVTLTRINMTPADSVATSND